MNERQAYCAACQMRRHDECVPETGCVCYCHPMPEEGGK